MPRKDEVVAYGVQLGKAGAVCSVVESAAKALYGVEVSGKLRKLLGCDWPSDARLVSHLRAELR